MAAWDALGKATWKLLKMYWPLILNAWNSVDDYLKKHPNIPVKTRRNLEKWRDSFTHAMRKRSPESRVAATIATVRQLASEQFASQSEDGDVATRVADWRRRSDAIAQALEIALASRGAARKHMIERITALADALAAEAFESLMPPDPDES